MLFCPYRLTSHRLSLRLDLALLTVLSELVQTGFSTSGRVTGKCCHLCPHLGLGLW